MLIVKSQVQASKCPASKRWRWSEQLRLDPAALGEWDLRSDAFWDSVAFTLGTIFSVSLFHSWPQIFCLLFNELHLKVHSLALQRWREFWDFDAPVKEIFLELSSTQFSGVSLLSGFFLLCVWLQWAANERCGARCKLQCAMCKVQTVNWNVQCDCAMCNVQSAMWLCNLSVSVCQIHSFTSASGLASSKSWIITIYP